MSEIFLRINLDESATAMTANFLRVMKCLLHRNRLIIVVPAEKGAAMSSLQRAGGLERRKISADGDRRCGKTARESFHRDSAVLAK
jgi:hypothetical protein